MHFVRYLIPVVVCRIMHTDMLDVIKRNNVTVIGSGEKTMMLAHGFGCDQNAWRSVISLVDPAYRLVLFDFVGAGKSDLKAYDAKRYSSLQGYASDVLEICECLELKDVVFVGHSVSSMIGLLAANRQPKMFKRLIFLGPSPCYLNDGEYQAGMDREDLESLMEVMESNFLGWSHFIAPKIMGNAERPELGQHLADSFCATDPEIAKKFARTTFLSDNRKDLSLLQVKSLSLQTNDDILAPEAASEYIFRHTPGNTRVLLNASGHCPHLSAPREVVNAINIFLN